VRLGNSFNQERNLSVQAMALGWNCLERFAERLSEFDAVHARALATQTLCEANDPRSLFHQNGYKMKSMNFPGWLGQRRCHSRSYGRRTDGQNGRKSRSQAACRHEVPPNGLFGFNQTAAH